MRHGNKLNHLGRKSAHRKAMLSNMACSLIEHKRISTTIAKAKALRVYVEPLLTKSKTDSTHSRRIVFSYLQSKEVVSELFRDVAPKIATRNGGYTRIIRLGYRLGDNAEMCMIELVDFNEIYTNETAKKTTRRSRRGGSTTSGAATTETVADAGAHGTAMPVIVLGASSPAEASRVMGTLTK
jgi:large subunit ribosomal protein L17